MIAVNWTDGASHFRYKKSANRTKDVGRYLANFIYEFAYDGNTKKVNLDSITLIGHSLGAQVAGFGIYKIKKNSSILMTSI